MICESVEVFRQLFTPTPLAIDQHGNRAEYDMLVAMEATKKKDMSKAEVDRLEMLRSETWDSWNNPEEEPQVECLKKWESVIEKLDDLGSMLEDFDLHDLTNGSIQSVQLRDTYWEAVEKVITTEIVKVNQAQGPAQIIKRNIRAKLQWHINCRTTRRERIPIPLVSPILLDRLKELVVAVNPAVEEVSIV